MNRFLEALMLGAIVGVALLAFIVGLLLWALAEIYA